MGDKSFDFDVVAPRATSAMVKFNDWEPFIMNFVENMDDRYVKNRFPGVKGTLYKE